MPSGKADYNRSRGCCRIKALEPGASMKSSAYIGVAVLLAIFMLAFATTLKARTQTNPRSMRVPMASSYDEVLPSQLASLPRRS